MFSEGREKVHWEQMRQFCWERYLVRPVHPSIENYTKLSVGDSLCFDEF